MKKNLNERDKNRISLLFALLCSIGYINYMIGNIFGIGGMIISLSLLAGAMLVSYKTVVKIKFPFSALALALAVTAYYIITRRLSYTTLFGKEFVLYFCVVSVLAMYQGNTEKFLRYMSYISLLVLLFYNQIFVQMTSTKAGDHISMGLAYSLFPLLVAPLYHLFFYRKESKGYMYAIYAVAIFLLIRLTLQGNRGILLSLVVGFCLIYIKGGENAKRNGFSVARTCLIMIFTVFIISYFFEIMGWLKNLFDDLGINAYFIEKILALDEAGDVTNGRERIFEYTLKEIFKKPIFGHGISTLYYNSSRRYIYPHNFILQLFYDGGAVVAVPVLLIVGRAVYYAIAGKNRHEAIFSLFLVTMALPSAMFSGDIWKNDFFWLLVMHSLKYHNMKEEKIEE